jgi:3-deoxy-7-phosphoheptulonate synthase
VQTRGNEFAHVVLRGGSAGPNYEPPHIEACEAALAKLELTQSIMVDCSHANSNKDHRQQRKVVESVMAQVAQGNRSITGLMIESHLNSGNQSINNPDGLSYGVSITDACIDWEETDALLRHLASELASRPQKN